MLMVATALFAATLVVAVESRVTTVTSEECNAAAQGCSSTLSSLASNSEGLELSLAGGGLYNLTSSIVITNASNLKIYGSGATVMSGYGLVAPLQFYDCAGLELRAMPPKPSTAGPLKGRGGPTATKEVAPGKCVA